MSTRGAIKEGALQTVSIDNGNLKPAIHLYRFSGEPRVDSRDIAQLLAISHQQVCETLIKYFGDFQEIGILRFQTEVLNGPGQPAKYALLNEDRAYLLLTYSRNTSRVRELKLRLVKEFRNARVSLDIRAADYLPTYRSLHNELSRLSEGTENARFIHININRVINQTVGLISGQRDRLSPEIQAGLVVAYSIGYRVIANAKDHKEAFRAIKAAMEKLSRALLDRPVDDFQNSRAGVDNEAAA